MFHPRRSCLALHHRKDASLTIHNLRSTTPLTALRHPHHPLFLKFWPGILGIGTKCFTLGWTVGGISACTLIWVDHFGAYMKLMMLLSAILMNCGIRQCKVSWLCSSRFIYFHGEQMWLISSFKKNVIDHYIVFYYDASFLLVWFMWWISLTLHIRKIIIHSIFLSTLMSLIFGYRKSWSKI